MSTAFRVGVLVFLALLFLTIGLFLIGNKDFLFSSTYLLKADFQNVGGLNNGSEVRLGGTHQGTIKEIDLPSKPDGKITVVMSLHSSTRNLIKRDSKAEIQTEGLLGDKYIEISFGSDKAEPVQNNDTIAGISAEDMSKQAQALADKASQGIEAFRDDMDALQHNFLLRGFFEKRGYNDTSELTQHSAAHLPKQKPIKEFSFDPQKLFDKPDNAKLKDKKALDEAGKYLQDNPFGLAVISSSEAKGDTDKDRLLSEARVKVVRDYLVQNFKLNDRRVETMGVGKTEGTQESSKLVILVYSTKPSGEATPHAPASHP